MTNTTSGLMISTSEFEFDVARRDLVLPFQLKHEHLRLVGVRTKIDLLEVECELNDIFL